MSRMVVMDCVVNGASNADKIKYGRESIPS